MLDIEPAWPVPDLAEVNSAAAEAVGYFDRVARSRTTWVNKEGAEAGCGDRQLLVARTANYLLAAEVAGDPPDGARLVDVGAGVGAYSAWLADRLDIPVTLVDHDPDVRAVAARAWPDAEVRDSTAALPDGGAWLVTAMEVVEHVLPEDQPAFIRDLLRLVAPGGHLVLSTPDESAYVGGWSGYGPHIGVLDASDLRDLLESASDHPAMVWRLEGEPFAVGPVEAALLPIANRAHTLLRRMAPTLLDRISHRVMSARSRISSTDRRPLPSHDIRVVDARQGRDTGLIGVIRVPG